MKKTFLIIFALLMTTSAFAQKKGQEMEPYRRSSLCMIMMEDPRIDQSIAPLVRQSFLSNPIPSKFNDHSVPAEFMAFNQSALEITVADKQAFNDFTGKKKKAKKDKSAEGTAVAAGTVGLLGALAGVEMGPSNKAYANPVVDTMKKVSEVAAFKYINDNNFAKKAVDRWFVGEDGNLNMKLVIDRINENATPEDKAAAAENSAAGVAGVTDYLINNGGLDLIGNTFITVSRFRYMTGPEMAAEILNGAAIGAQFLPQSAADMVMSTAELSATAATLAIGKGYCINTTTYLYRLEWTPEAQFAAGQGFGERSSYENYPYTLEYVGEESAYCQVSVGKRDLDEAVRFAVGRSLDKVLAKLEKKYEVFRTKTPLTSVDPITASIGTKECVEVGDKYEILASSLNTKTGEVTYKSVGTLKVETVGNNMGEDNDDEKASSDPFTTFSGKLPKNAYPGMLIRQAGKK